jgi:hypothetical protein
LLSSCAWAFQEREPGAYTPTHEPRCTTVPGWRLLDLGMAVLDVGSAIAADHEGQSKVVVGLAVVPVLFHLSSWMRGRAWAADCERARRDYDYERLPDIASRPAPPPESTQRPPQPQAAPPPPPPRHGWCFDIGGGEVVCYDTRESCQAELEHAEAAHGDCQQQ